MDQRHRSRFLSLMPQRPPMRLLPLLCLALLRRRFSLLSLGWRCLLTLGQLRGLRLRLIRGRRHVDGIRFVDALLKAFDRLAKPFPKLWDLAGSENDQHDDQNQKQFHPSK